MVQTFAGQDGGAEGGDPAGQLPQDRGAAVHGGAAHHRQAGSQPQAQEGGGPLVLLQPL